MTTAAAQPSQSDEPVEAYVLLHRDTGAVLYSTVATATEISEANQHLGECGLRHRYVAARLLPHGEVEADQPPSCQTDT
jgi:hypothetical protein